MQQVLLTGPSPRLPIIAIRSLCLLVALWLGFAGCNPRQKPVRPQRRDITQAVYASGKVYPARYYRVSASTPGYLDQVLLHVGDTVQVGQPLFIVRNDLAPLSVEQSQTALSAARTNASESASPIIGSAREQLEAARARYRLDSANYGRYANLQQAGAGTAQALDQARTQFEVSRTNVQQAEANLASTHLRVRTELTNARTAYQAQRTSQKNYTVTSAIRGMVYDQVPKVGEYVGPQTVVLELGETASYEVELSIDETDLNYVRPGQEVFYGGEAFGSQLASGRIREVYPKIGLTNKSIKAIATITLPPGQMVYAGSTLEANIIYQRKKAALVLPKAYVLQDSITIRQRGKYLRRPVKTGISDVESVEILQGATDQTEVYKPL